MGLVSPQPNKIILLDHLSKSNSRHNNVCACVHVCARGGARGGRGGAVGPPARQKNNRVAFKF